jgi:RNA polymerase sigma factor (TIGR02999 family)
MSTSPADELAALVERAESGEPEAKNALFTALYGELHRLAQGHLHRSGGQLTLSATTLLHEAYLNISGRDAVAFPDRLRFLAYASRAMRGLVIDYVRTKRAQKRGGDLTFTSLDEATVEMPAEAAELERLVPALEHLSVLDPALVELVDLKFFCGFTFAQIAEMRQVSTRTVRRDWAKARLLLHAALTDDEQA